MSQGIEKLLAAGDYACAFDRLVPAFKDRGFRLSCSILRDTAAAEDATQETFLKIWRALPDFDGRAALGTWIYAIARNTCLMELRRARPAVSLDNLDHAESQRAMASIATGPAADPERDNIPKLIARLPTKQQIAVRLFYLEDRSYDAVAESLDMPLGTVKNLLHRARKQLARLARRPVEKAA